MAGCFQRIPVDLDAPPWEKERGSERSPVTLFLRGEWAGGPYHILMAGFRAEASGEIAADFHGQNVGEARWARPHELDLHSTDLRILTDAKLASFPEAQIAAALQKDGIDLRVYQTEVQAG